MTKQQANIISAICLILSVAVSYESFTISFSQAYAGRAINGWLAFLAFFVAIGLVLTAIIVPYRARKR